MATLYGRGRGKAGSHKPVFTEKPEWIVLSNKQIEELIVKLAKEGNTSAKIGLILRDTYGINNVRGILGKKIEKVLKENKIDYEPHELNAVEKKHKKLKKHFENNKQDKVAKRGLQLTEVKIRRLKKYHKK